MNKIAPRLAMILLNLLITGYSLVPCAAQSTLSTKSQPMETLDDDLAQKLMNDAYGDFFNYAQRAQAIQNVWTESNSLDRLKTIIKNEQLPLKARFLACEVLFEKHFVFVGEVGADTIAHLYAQALVHNQTGMANSWGLLYKHKDSGPVGIRFSMLGKASIAPLIKLLDNDQTLVYAGSKEATVGNAYQYRIKDFAAFYLSNITDTSIRFHQNLAKRDAAIAKFKRKLMKR